MISSLAELQWPLVFMSGLMGSAHCAGMCGPFAAMIASTNGGSNLLRQLTYSVGRLFTYAWLGAIAGFAGQQLMDQSAALTKINPAAILAALAGTFLLYEGSKTVGLLPRASALKSRANTQVCAPPAATSTAITRGAST